MIYRVSLNGKVYEVEVEKGEAVIKSEFDAMIPQAPVAPVATSRATSAPAPAPATQSAPTAGANVVSAPMPGNINAVKVAGGQSVKEGEVLIILEAMKMENEITAPKAGKIGQIYVQKGATVETGAPLIEVL